MHARLARPGCGRPSTPAWRRPAPGQPWPLVSRPSSSSWPPSRSRCWCPATARRAARARRPTRRRAIRQERRERRSRCRRARRGRARPRCLQHPRRPLTRSRRLRSRRLRLRIPPRLRRSPPRLRPVPRRAAHPDTQGITAAEPRNLVQRPTAPNTQICAPRETSAKSQAAAPNGGSGSWGNSEHSRSVINLLVRLPPTRQPPDRTAASARQSPATRSATAPGAPGASGRRGVRDAQRAAAHRTWLAEPGGQPPGDRAGAYRQARQRRVPGYGRSSRTTLTGVWVTCRNRLKPASPASCRTAAGPAWAPSATPPGWARAAGVHWNVDAA